MSARLDHVMPVTIRPPVVMTEGRGSWLRDSEGRRYLDFVQGWAVNCRGHSDPAMVDTIRTQAARLINCSPAFHNKRNGPPDRADRRVQWPRPRLLCTSGAEANEGAIKLAQVGQAPPRRRPRDRHHPRELPRLHAGHHVGSGKPAFERLFEPKVPGFPKVPLNDLDAMAAAITGRTVAVILEPIQGEAGRDPGDGRLSPGGVRAQSRSRRAADPRRIGNTKVTRS
jgi:acetylornithine/N-succinyldiaminopimelate aminotransferase